MRQLYPWDPVLSPQSPVEIADVLTNLYADPGARRRLVERTVNGRSNFIRLNARARDTSSRLSC